MTSVTIPNTVTYVGVEAFAFCTSLTAITVDALNATYTSVNGVLFNKAQTTLFQYPGGKDGSYAIPNSVTNIEGRAFASCTSLISVTIPNSVTSIPEGAFAFCTNLMSIIVDPLNATYSSVEGLLFSKSMTLLMQYPGGKLGSYTVPNNVTNIAGYAFGGCTRLTSVTLPKSVTAIWERAFVLCTSLINVTLPSSVIIIGEYAFGQCTNLASVTIPGSVRDIGGGAFQSCANLTNVLIGNGVTAIPDYAFAYCSSLASVMVPISVTSVGGHAFYCCERLTGVYFGGNAPIAGEEMFFFAPNAVVYHVPGATGWGTAFGGRPTALWVLSQPVILTTSPSFGIRTNQFGFLISWPTNASVVVEANTSPASGNWRPVSTNTLTSGSSSFSDPEWTNYFARFYRIRSPR